MRAAVRRAWAAWELRRPEEAIRLAGAAVAEDADDADAYLVLAKALAQVGRSEEALVALDRAVVLAPWWARPHLVRFDVLSRQGSSDGALAAADEAARLAPKLAAAHMARGLGLAALGRRAEAILAADEAVRLEPGNAYVLASRGDVSLDDQPAVAEGFYRRSLAIDPQQAATLNNLGAALRRQGRDADAVAAYRSALLVDPTLTVAQRNLAALVRIVPGASTTDVADPPIRRVSIAVAAVAAASVTWDSLMPHSGPVSPVVAALIIIAVARWSNGVRRGEGGSPRPGSAMRLVP